VVDFDELRRAVLEREAVMSTGVGQGLALPHAKTDAVRGTIAALGVTESPIDFGSIDGQPVRIVFMLLGTASARSLHIKILSRISRLMNRAAVRESLMGARSGDEALEAILVAESDLLDH
jgi:mannitol/fructose-specific phosphotransferase system IIA component (Ntr-type)